MRIENSVVELQLHVVQLFGELWCSTVPFGSFRTFYIQKATSRKEIGMPYQVMSL